jgi:hypothetical protein
VESAPRSAWVGSVPSVAISSKSLLCTDDPFSLNSNFRDECSERAIYKVNQSVGQKNGTVSFGSKTDIARCLKQMPHNTAVEPTPTASAALPLLARLTASVRHHNHGRERLCSGWAFRNV